MTLLVKILLCYECGSIKSCGNGLGPNVSSHTHLGCSEDNKSDVTFENFIKPHKTPK